MEKFLQAIKRSQLKTIKQLSTQMENIDFHTNKEEDTPLIFAAKNNLAASANVLINVGADVNARNGNNNTALHFVALHDRLTLLTVLIDAGANTCARNQDGLSALGIARNNSNQRAQAILIEAMK